MATIMVFLAEILQALTSKPVSDEFMALKGKAGPTFIRLVQIDTFIPCHYELQVLRRVAEG